MLLQLFGCVDWAPSDLITAFLLAGAAQSARRRVQVAAIMAAGGPGSAPSSERKASGPLPTPALCVHYAECHHRSVNSEDCQGLSRMLLGPHQIWHTRDQNLVLAEEIVAKLMSS